jgi:hypothetical protein
MISVKNLLSNLSYQQNRKYIISFSEFFSLSKKTPSDLNNIDFEENPKDPFFFLTQSQKNYQDFEKVIENYSNPDYFKNFISDYGISKKIDYHKTSPIYYYLQDNNNWYFKQNKLLKLSYLFALTPGFLEMRLISSASLGISSKNSDIDIIIKTKKGHVLATRLWVKLLVLKILRLDVHSTRLETLIMITRWLKKNYSHKFLHSFEKIVETKIEKFKNRPSLKIDLGVCFSDEITLENYFGTDPRQYFWLYNSKKIILNLDEVLERDRNSLEITNQINQSKSDQNHSNNPTTLLDNSNLNLNDTISRQNIGLLYIPRTTLLNTLLIKTLKPIVFVMYYLVYPLSYLQTPFYRSKNKHNPNFIYNKNIISFIPLIYKSGYTYKKIS